MITEQEANEFAIEWITAWNSHCIEKILAHYADEIIFYSPFIPLLNFNDKGEIRNKADLRKYFETGLGAYPNLRFQLHHYFTGINTVVIFYTSVNSRMAAEVFELDRNGKAIKVLCHYAT